MQRFSFLEERFPELAVYGRKAEESFDTDKNICLLNLGRMAEYITKILCSQNNIEASDADELLELGIIDENIHRKIKTLIEVKDDAVNDEYDSEMSCERLILTAEELCRWFVNERGESRFSFLADLFPDSNPVPPLADLAVYGREAEENLFPNTRYSLICLGDIEESIVEHIMNLKGIEADLHENDQSDRINLLYHKDIISKENKDILHELRLARNKAVHSRYNSCEEGRRLIDEALSVCEWTFRFMMSAGNFVRGIIRKVNENSIDVTAGRIQCIVEGEDIPESDEALIERYKEGERRIFKVIDSESEIIRLSIKEVYTDPWLNIARRYARYEIGQILNVKVMSFTDFKGAVVEIIGPLEITEAMIPETEYGTKKPHIGEEVKACVKWFNPKSYPYMILSVKDAPVEKKSFVAMCADASPEEIHERLSEGVDVNEKNHNGMTALMNAAMHNDNPEVIRVLIDAGAKVNAVNMNSSGNTALIFAAMYNNPDAVKALIDNGADITTTNTEGKTAYDYAQNNEKLKDSDIMNLLKVKKALTHEEFLELCRTGSLDEILDALNDSELDVNSLDNDGRNALMFACMGNNADVIRALIEKTNDINAQDKQGNTALMFACDSNDADAVNALLDSGADINIENQNGFAAMIFAMDNNSLKDTEIISRLTPEQSEPIDEPAHEQPEPTDEPAHEQPEPTSEQPELTDESMHKQPESIDEPMHEQPEPTTEQPKPTDEPAHEQPEPTTEQPKLTDEEFIELCGKGTAEEITNAINKGANVRAENSKGQTALMLAAQNNTPEIISLLLDLGAAINHVDSLGNTALTLAFMNENNAEENMNMLLDYGADPDIQNNAGYNALMTAAKTKGIDVVKKLLEITSDVNAKNNAGDTALSIASTENNAEVVNALLEAGADINSQNENGSTALMSALYNSSDVENIIKLLIAHKPDLTLRNAKGQTALNIAKNRPTLSGSRALVLLLKGEFLKLCRSGSDEEISQAINAGVDVHTRNKSQATGLMFAAQHNTASAVEVLIDAGSDIDAQDINGNTALIYAASYNTDDVVDLLINKGADVNIMNHSGHKALKFAKRNYRLFDTVAINVLEELTRD